MLRAADKKLHLSQGVSSDIYVPSPRLARLSPKKRVIGPASPEFSTHFLSAALRGSGAKTWFSANDPLAIPFTLTEASIVTHLVWANGSNLTDNFDLGIYDLAFNRLVSTGSTARSGASVLQSVNVTDTSLLPGRYYLAMSNAGVTVSSGGAGMTSTTAAVLAINGVLDSATDAFPLPDPLTNMAAAATALYFPWVYIVLNGARLG